MKTWRSCAGPANLKILAPSNPDELEGGGYGSPRIATRARYTSAACRDAVPNLPAKRNGADGKAVVVEDDGNDFALIYEGSATELAFKSFEGLP